LSTYIENAEHKRVHLVPPLMQEPTHGIDVLSTTMDETEEGSNQQPKSIPHLAVEEVGGPQHVHMHTDELPPRHGLFALRSWWDAMALEDIAYCLVTDRIAQVGQRTHDAIIPPRAILAGHPHHQVFALLIKARTAHGLIELGTRTLLVHACAVPSQDSVGLGNRGKLFQDLFVQLLAELGECFALIIRELHTTINLLTAKAVLRSQVCITKPKLFVNRRGDRPQQFFPVHTSIIPAKTSYVDG
jgi:hypothetical protein